MNSTRIEKQYALQKWAGIIKQQQECTLPLKEWLSQNNITKDQYYYWKRKLKDTVLDDLVQGFVEIPSLPVQDKVAQVVKLVQPPQPAMVSNETVATITVGSAVININGNASQDFLRNLFGAVSHA
jgi:hypothetical protein